jgi:signal transduction histidine kinase
MTATEIESRKQEEERIRQENVRLEERTRIARELHDTLLQTIQGATLHLAAMLRDAASDSSVKPRLEWILQLMSQGIEEGRNTIQGLRSSDSRPDLVQALSRVREEVAPHPEIDFRITVFGQEQPLRPVITEELYRIGREALVNAFRDSKAERVELQLEYANSGLRMRVHDNGCGIDSQVLQTGREGHWGLAGMQERAARIGGLVEYSSSRSTGTEITLSIPGRVAFQLPLG